MSINAGVIALGAVAYEAASFTVSTVASATIASKLKNQKGDLKTMMNINEFKNALKAKKEAAEKKDEKKSTAGRMFDAAVNVKRSVTPVTEKKLDEHVELLMDLIAEQELRIQALEKKAKIKPAEEQVSRETLDQTKDAMYKRWVAMNTPKKEEVKIVEPKKEEVVAAEPTDEEQEAAALKEQMQAAKQQLAELKKRKTAEAQQVQVEEQPVQKSGTRMRVNFTKTAKAE